MKFTSPFFFVKLRCQTFHTYMPGILSQYRRRKDNRLRQQNLTAAAPAPRSKASQRLAQQRAAAAQAKLQKVKSIFETRTDHISKPGVELQDWVAFGICATAFLLIVHFFVGWWTIVGGLVLSLNVFLLYIEIPQSNLNLSPNLKLPPASVHGVSIALQLVFLLGYLWLPHWASICVQILLSGSAIWLLHKLRNPTEETIFDRYKR